MRSPPSHSDTRNGHETPASLRSYLPPASANTADSQFAVRLLTSAISAALESNDDLFLFPSDDDTDADRFASAPAPPPANNSKDDRFETLAGAHLQSAQQNADHKLFGVDALGGTTTRRYIEGLPSESEDYETIEGSSVADGDRIDPNLIKTLLG